MNDRVYSLISHLRQVAAPLAERSASAARRFTGTLAARMETLIPIWIVLFMALATLRIVFALTPIRGLADFAELFLPYALIALAPALGYRLALAAYPPERRLPQPSLRLAVIGRWRRLDPDDARAHPAYGPFGFMASLLLGLLLNVPVRALEFLAAVPAMNLQAPEWGRTLFYTMAFDVCAMGFIYMACFVMALRSVPYFPRLLGIAWLIDISLQFTIARAVAASAGLPPTVAHGLSELLQGNVTKVLISAGVWLPYLLLSERVNVTYRQRAPGI